MFFKTSFGTIFCLAQLATSLGIDFTTPPGGATIPASNVTVSWRDDGGSPSMADLTKSNLSLIVGGILPNSSQIIQSWSPLQISDGTASVNISKDVAQSIQNGFYFQMLSNTTGGNTVINYSDRFTLIELTGYTSANYVQAAGLHGAITDVPSAQYNIMPGPPSIADPTSPSASPTSLTVATSGSASDDSASQHLISTGQIAGIAVAGIFVGITLLALAVLFFYLRKRRRDRQRQQEEDTDLTSMSFGGGESKAELPANGLSSPTDRSRGLPQALYEVSGDDKPHELAGTVVVHELEGDLALSEMSSRNSRVASPYDPTN